MDITISPTKLSGSITAIPSKSQAHRLLICAAFSDKETHLICPETNRDIEATADCLSALGATVIRCNDGYQITPIDHIPHTAVLDCCESGSTLRFMLPIVGALGVDATFLMAGRLPQRPLSPLWEEMERMGCSLHRPSPTTLRCQGKLTGGTYRISGNVSSQFITGLLFAAALMKDACRIQIIGKLESQPYVQMTQLALKQFGIDSTQYRIEGSQSLHSPGMLTVEGDWSNGAFFLAAATLGSHLTVSNLNPNSPQGDRAISYWLNRLEKEYCTISAADIPDLVPILAVVAGQKHGACFTDIQRLRLKETDRVSTVCAMIEALGGKAVSTDNKITITPGNYHSCTIYAENDHRIAMSAAIAATVASGPVTIVNADSVNKSYPNFWNEYRRLGGNYEQYIR